MAAYIHLGFELQQCSIRGSRSGTFGHMKMVDQRQTAGVQSVRVVAIASMNHKHVHVYIKCSAYCSVNSSARLVSFVVAKSA